MFYDSHVHFDGLGEPEEWQDAVLRAREAGVGGVLAVGGSAAMNAAAIEAVRSFPGFARCALGMDRDQAPADAAGARAALEKLLDEIRRGMAAGIDVRAVGEIGLDFHYHPETAASQIGLFRAQLKAARELELPVVVHSREADAETIEALAEHRAAWQGEPGRVGVLHCFTGSREFAEQLLALDFYISFSGIITFRNADALRAVAREIPAEKLLVETDTPYLAPAPHRGKPNEPSYLPCVAAKLAEVRGCSIEDTAIVTHRNAERLFG